MDSNASLFDAQKNHSLTDGDLPAGIDAETVIAFCEAHYMHFHALGTPPGIYGEGWDDPRVFRVATFNHPSRGLTVAWETVLEWKEIQESIAACHI